jgi:DNA primase
MTRQQIKPFRGGIRRPFSRRREHRPDRSAESVLAAVNVEAFYMEALGNLAGHGDWRTAKCVFHDDAHASLRINVQHGGFACMTCGAKGGSVARFIMKRDDMGFANALRLLEGLA